MRFLLAGALIAVPLLLLPLPAEGQGIYGVSSGLVLEAWPNYNPPICPPATCCGGVELVVSVGTFYLNGVPYSLSATEAAEEFIYSGGSVDGGAGCGFSPTLTADT